MAAFSINLCVPWSCHAAQCTYQMCVCALCTGHAYISEMNTVLGTTMQYHH